MTVLRGELEAFQVRGSDFWGTGRIRTGGKDGVVDVVGKLFGAQPGDSLELTGEWTTHPRFGKQFKVFRAETVAPASKAGVISWLESRFPDVGRRRAEALVTTFGDDLWDVIETEPGRLTTVEGITPKRAEAIAEAYAQFRDERDRMIALRAYGLTDNQIGALVARHGEGALERIKANPYSLISEVRGFGWERADRLAQRMGLTREAPVRLDAGVFHTLKLAAAAGHTSMSSGKLVAKAARILRIDESQLAKHLHRRSEPPPGVSVWATRYYLSNLAEAEHDSAQRMAGILSEGA